MNEETPAAQDVVKAPAPTITTTPPPSFEQKQAVQPNLESKVTLATADKSPPAQPGLALLNQRLAAGLIDWLVMIGLVILLTTILPGFIDSISWLIGLAYLVTRDSLSFLGGQSIGKKAMKIKAVTMDNKSLVDQWETALFRNGPLIIPFFALIEIFILITRENQLQKGKRLGDEWAKTKVIIAPTEPKPTSDVAS